MPKFTQEMANVLLESNYRAYRSAISKAIPLLYKSVTDKYYAEIADMTKTAQESECKIYFPRFRLITR